MQNAQAQRTIKDFGKQWISYTDNEGYYGSKELFEDLFAPLIRPEELRGKRVADIGSGTGRIVNMLLDCGAVSVLAIEPSDAVNVLVENVKARVDAVTVLHSTGDQIPPGLNLDYVFSVGVLHHIPDPMPVVRAAREALQPGGKLAIWLYGKEGNRLYLALIACLRALTIRLPHPFLVGFCWIIYPLLALYITLCKILPLPMQRYMNEHLGRLSVSKQVLTIYDQLNPTYAKYYAREEAIKLLEDSGYSEIQLEHRHGYSWTVVGTKR